MSIKPSAGDLTRSVRILVVDDEEIVRTVIREVLERPGWYLVEAEDGEQAIGLLLKEPFDLLIADKNLPGITGLDVIRRAKASDPRIGTLLVTAFASRESAEEALALGIDDYLCKPFDMSDLEAKVFEALERREQRAGVPEIEPLVPVSLRALVIDEEKRSQQLLVQGLTLLGHQARTVDSLGRALEALRKKELDVLVCDLRVLNRDDASACFLRSALIMTPGVKFVAVAGSIGLDSAIQAVNRGARKVMYRPLVSAEDVADELREFLGATK